MAQREHEKALLDKLTKLTNSQQSVQSLSLWVIYHMKKYKESVDVLKREILRVPPNRKLVYLYLINDILQTSRKKTLDFIREFSDSIIDIIACVYSEANEKDKKAIMRIVSIWEERKVFSSSIVKDLRQAAGMPAGSSGSIGIGSSSSSSSRIRSPESTTPPHHPSPSSSSAAAAPTPLARAVLAMDKLERDSLHYRRDVVDRIVEDFPRLEQRMKDSDDSRINNMGLLELEETRNHFAKNLAAITDVRNHFDREREQRAELLRLMKEEISKQEVRMQNIEEDIKQWNQRINTTQGFLTKIEMKLNLKKVEEDYIHSPTTTPPPATSTTAAHFLGGDSDGYEPTTPPLPLNDDYDLDNNNNNNSTSTSSTSNNDSDMIGGPLAKKLKQHHTGGGLPTEIAPPTPKELQGTGASLQAPDLDSIFNALSSGAPPVVITPTSSANSALKTQQPQQQPQQQQQQQPLYTPQMPQQPQYYPQQQQQRPTDPRLADPRLALRQQRSMPTGAGPTTTVPPVPVAAQHISPYGPPPLPQQQQQQQYIPTTTQQHPQQHQHQYAQPPPFLNEDEL